MNLLQAIVLSILQGATELFPVSSLGNTIVLPVLLGWHNFDMSSKSPFLPYVVTLHMGTALALIVYYWADWKRMISSFFRSLLGWAKEDVDSRVCWLLLIGTIPVGLLGFVLQEPLRTLFGSPLFASIFLILNGAVMIGGERLRKASDVAPSREADLVQTGVRKHLDSLSWWSAAAVGLAQSLALLPGISRSGAAIVGGLLTKLTHQDAARFAFLLGTPVILLAGILEIPDLNDSPHKVPHIYQYAGLGFVLSAITAYLSVRFLTKYFETRRLDPFGYYCIVLGLVTLGFLHFHPV